NVGLARQHRRQIRRVRLWIAVQVEVDEQLAVGVDADPGVRQALREHLLHDAHPVKPLKGSWLDTVGTRGVGKLGDLVNDPARDAAAEQLAGERQTGRPCTDDQYVGIRTLRWVVHDVHSADEVPRTRPPQGLLAG